MTATSGAKNVIIMIDTSGSMDGKRLLIAKDAANAVVNTLSNSDFVGVINFSNEANNIYSNHIMRATSKVKEYIVD